MKQNEQSKAGHKRFLFVKKRLKRAAALAGILITALSLSGCKNFVETDVGAETKFTKQAVSETTSLTNQEETKFVTEFEITDWSPSDFCTITCHNATVSIPCKFSDIDDKFDKKIVKSNEQNISKLDYVELYLDDEYVGSLYFAEYDYDIENDFLSFASLETFDIKGLNEHSSKKDVQKKLGVGNHIDFEYGDSYYVDNMMIIFNYLNNKTSLTIIVYEEE